MKLVNPRVYPTSVVLDASSKVQKVIPGHLEKAEIKALFPMMKMDMKQMDKMDAMKKDEKNEYGKNGRQDDER